MQKALANHEIVTLAVFLLGGSGSIIDTEDVAVKANEIAPGRFAWRRYPEQINLDAVRKRLWDARKVEKGGYLTGSEKSGWSLTEQGLAFAKLKSKGIRKLKLARQPLGLKERRWIKVERARMLTSPELAKFRDRRSGLDFKDAERFFRLDSYLQGKARERRITRILEYFAEDKELGEVIAVLAAMLKGAKP